MVHFKTLFAAVLSLSVATCNPVAKRDAALVVSSNGISLDTAINKAATDANASAAFTAAQSTSITSAIGTLTPQIQTTLSALVNKEPLFDASALDPLVLSQLQTLLADSDKLGVAIQAKAVAADVTTLKGYQSTIDTSFAFAIAVFT